MPKAKPKSKPDAEPVAVSPPPAPEFDPFEQEELDEAAEREAKIKAAEEAAKAKPPEEAAPVASSSTTVNPPAAETTPTPRHSQRLTQRARDWGFSQAQLDSMTSEELNDAIYERQRAVHLQAEARAEAERKAQQPAPQPKADDEDDLSGDDLKDWGDAATPILKRDAVLKAEREARKALEKRLADIEAREKDREVRTQRSLQKRFEQKQEQYKAVFTEDAQGKAKWRAVIAYMQGLEREDTDRLESDFDEGIKLLGFSSPPQATATSPPPPPAPPAKTPEEEKLAAEREKWAESGSAHASSRSIDELPLGDERAYRRLKDKWRHREESLSDEDYDEKYGLNGKGRTKTKT